MGRRVEKDTVHVTGMTGHCSFDILCALVCDDFSTASSFLNFT